MKYYGRLFGEERGKRTRYWDTGKTGKDWEKIEQERDEAMRQNACIPRSGLALGSLLVKHGILDAQVVEDPEGYDGGRTLAALYDAHMEMVSENAESIRAEIKP